MIPTTLLNTTVTVKRRTSTGRDSLNNPIYGTPTSGAGYNNIIYQNIQVRLAFSSKSIRFSREGERITPTGIMYCNNQYDILPEDRVLTSDGIEYVVTAATIAYGPVGSVVDHYEFVLSLP